MKQLCECKTKKLIEILKTFDEATQAEIGTVTDLDSNMNPIPETARQATDRDNLDFLLHAWSETSESLLELGIDLEEISGDECI